MVENEHDFRKVVAGLKINDEPDPAHRERLRRQMLQTYEETARSGVSNLRFQIPNLRSLAIAATILIAATVLITATVRTWTWLSSDNPSTFDEVAAATKRLPWMHAVIKATAGSEIRTREHWYNFAAKKTYVVTKDGGVLGWEYGAEHTQFVYSPSVKTVTISDLTSVSPFGAESTYNLVDAFGVFVAKNGGRVGTAAHREWGRTVRSYEVEGTVRGISIANQSAAKLRIEVLTDRWTGRVASANVEYCGQRGNTLGREFWTIDYPRSGPGSIFDLGVPAGTRVIDRRQQPIGTPGDEPSIIPTPAPTSGSRNLVPLTIKLPRPQFVGTPQDARTPNLEQPRGRPRPPFLAPPGTTNVALGKPVSASDRDPLYGSLDMVTDGDKETDDGSFIELGPKPQYITIDLGERCEIYAILVWHYHKLPRVYFDVVVQISDDKNFRTGVTTVFNNDRDNSLGLGAGTDLHYTETNEGKLIDSKGVQGRYVRLYSNGNTSDDLNHYIEVEVYGRPIRLIRDN